MNKIGFYYQDESNHRKNSPQEAENFTKEVKRCIAKVRFEDDSEYPYYNDKFCLSIGDKVYVDGKKYGYVGTVISITTKFKVNAQLYKSIIAKLNFDFHASFKKIESFMISKDKDFIDFEQISSWFILPKSDDDIEDEYLIGDGYECLIGDIINCNDVTEENFKEGFELLINGKVKAIWVKDGIGHAIVQNHKATVVDFKIKNEMIKDIYCECISPDFCKHSLAICIAIEYLIRNNHIDEKEDFVAIDFGFFINIICKNETQITI